MGAADPKHFSSPAPGTAGAGQPDFGVAIVGTGFGGLCMAIKLREEGRDDFVLIERGDSVGGTWRDNSYPGAACDVPSHLYSLSFVPKADWSRIYPSQPELHAYLREIGDRYRLLPNTRLNTRFIGADYDEATQLWNIRVSDAQGEHQFSARALVLANGGLAEPKLPDIPGVERFQGKTFHSAQWDHDYDLRGKRVGVIGSGASAIQFVPEIAPKVERLDVYQRTPNWIIPRPDRPYTDREKSLLANVPLLRRFYRAVIYAWHELRVLGMVVHPALMKWFAKVSERHIRRQVKDLALRKRITPEYLIGCRRILISNDWYPALARPNVDLITDGIREIRENAIVSEDGTVREIDCLIFGTGFYATENPIGRVVRGRDGKSLAQAWRNGAEAYLGTVVKGFPNLFLIVGPNTGVGHTSMIYIIESQVQLIRQLIAKLRGNVGALEVRAEVQDRFNQSLHKRLATSVWATGCRSWYQDRNGKITALWPGFTFDFRRRTSKAVESEYHFEALRKKILG